MFPFLQEAPPPRLHPPSAQAEPILGSAFMALGAWQRPSVGSPKLIQIPDLMRPPGKGTTLFPYPENLRQKPPAQS